MIIFLFGPPGSGKGTQARDVAAAMDVPHVATGDIFRRHLREGTELGQLARSYMDRGALVPDRVTCDLVASRLGEADAAGGVLLDGFPRSVEQAEWLLRWLGTHLPLPMLVLNLAVPDAELVVRISGRRTCVRCGATYHVVHQPPAPAGCTSCGSAEVVQRVDDQEAVVTARLATYHHQTAPVLSVLGREARVCNIDGVGTIAEIAARVAAELPLGSP